MVLLVMTSTKPIFCRKEKGLFDACQLELLFSLLTDYKELGEQFKKQMNPEGEQNKNTKNAYSFCMALRLGLAMSLIMV